jgi:hypothetical protein
MLLDGEVRYAKTKDQTRGCKALQENRLRKNHQEQSFRQPHSDEENHQKKKKHQEITGGQFCEREEHQQTHSLSVEGLNRIRMISSQGTPERKSNFLCESEVESCPG